MTTLRIVCKNLETEGSKGLGITNYAHGVVIKEDHLLVWSYIHCNVYIYICCRNLTGY